MASMPFGMVKIEETEELATHLRRSGSLYARKARNCGIRACYSESPLARTCEVQHRVKYNICKNTVYEAVFTSATERFEVNRPLILSSRTTRLSGTREYTAQDVEHGRPH